MYEISPRCRIKFLRVRFRSLPAVIANSDASGEYPFDRKFSGRFAFGSQRSGLEVCKGSPDDDSDPKRAALGNVM